MPFWNDATYRAIRDSLTSGSVVDGSAISVLRSLIIETLEVEGAILCGSGSSALELALRACGVGHGDEVIIPAFCCSAIVPPVLALGALPVLADIGEELNLTGETVDAVITKKTRAVIVPHLFGNPADINAIVELARGKNIRVIDDAAQALGATVDGRSVGSFGDAGIVSFGNEKICFGLGGGAVVSSRQALLDRDALNLSTAKSSLVMRQLASTQICWRWRRWTLPLLTILSRDKSAGPDALPIPYRTETMANLQAAVALSLMRSLRENIAARRARLSAYRDLLGGEDRLELIPHRPGSACLTQVVRVSPRDRGRDLASVLIAALGKSGYEIQGSYVPIHLLSCFDRCVWDRLPNADRFWLDLIELPCDPGVSLEDVERISTLVKKFLPADAALRERTVSI
ncbi:MAG: DegT/DnrJ/EryC1/StrS family aminotransferase [Candidatus Binatia bacterium]